MGSQFKGYIIGVLAAALYGMNPLFALPLYSEGMNTDSVLLIRYAIAIPIIGLMCVFRGRTLRVDFRQLMVLIALGVVMGFSSLGLFLSYRYMDAGIASTLLFVYPLMVAVIMTLVFHERFTLRTGICLAMAMGGILLLYNGDGSQTLSLTGVMLVMVSSLSYAIYIVAVNTRLVKSIATLPLTFYVLLFGSLVFAVRLLDTGDFMLPADMFSWGCALCLSILPTTLSLILTTMAIQRIGSTPTAILGVFEPVTALVFGVIVFGEILTGRDVTGLLLILTAVCYVIAGDSVGLRLNRVRKMFPRRHRRS